MHLGLHYIVQGFGLYLSNSHAVLRYLGHIFPGGATRELSSSETGADGIFLQMILTATLRSSCGGCSYGYWQPIFIRKSMQVSLYGSRLGCNRSHLFALSKSGCWQDIVAAPRPTQRQNGTPVLVPEVLHELGAPVSATGHSIRP